MSKNVQTGFGISAALLVTLIFCGCGSKEQVSGRPEVEQVPAEEHLGSATKATLYELRAKVRKHGLKVVKRELPEVIGNFEGYEKRPVGEHLETYKQIAEKLKSMESAASNEAAVKTANEIGDLADKLPGKANPNPQVE